MSSYRFKGKPEKEKIGEIEKEIIAWCDEIENAPDENWIYYQDELGAITSKQKKKHATE